MGKHYRAVFFDVGYTLVYFQPSAQALFMQALADVGVETTPETVDAAFRTARLVDTANAATATFEASWIADRQRELAMRARFLRQLGVQDDGVAAALFEREDALFSAPGATRLYPEITQVLSQLLAQDLGLGIISNWSWNLRRRLDQVGLVPYFEHITASAYAGCEKPHPAIFERALRAMRVSPAEAIHVGDSYEADIVGARGVGMDAALIWREQEPAPYTDCPVLHSLEDLLPLLGD